MNSKHRGVSGYWMRNCRGSQRSVHPSEASGAPVACNKGLEGIPPTVILGCFSFGFLTSVNISAQVSHKLEHNIGIRN